MNRLIRKSLTVAAFFTVLIAKSYATQTTGNIEYFNVTAGVVKFKTNNTANYTKASCATDANLNVHTLSLSHATGRAMYAALVAASSANKPVTLSLAGNCNDTLEVEAITSLTVSQLNSGSNGSSVSTLLKLVGTGYSYYQNSNYYCQIYATAKNSANQPYIYDSGGSCLCRDSQLSATFVNPDNGKGYRTHISCYIEE